MIRSELRAMERLTLQPLRLAPNRVYRIYRGGAMLGASHVARHGVELGVLCKLLDSAMRLAIQCLATSGAPRISVSWASVLSWGCGVSTSKPRAWNTCRGTCSPRRSFTKMGMGEKRSWLAHSLEQV